MLRDKEILKKKELLSEIYREDKIEDSYLIFQHNDKIWVMPKASLKAALDMYQPSTFKGKILKHLVLICRDFSFIASTIGISSVKLGNNKGIYDYICNIMGSDNFYVAGYMGDTSSRQNNKATLQIYDDKEIVGYAKITKDEQVEKTFEHEIDALKVLEEKGISNVPRVLGTDYIDGMHIFIQSTDKTFGEKVNLKFGKQQIEFIKNIVEATKIKVEYQDTDFYKSVQYLKSKIEDFDLEEKNILAQSISIVEEKLSEKPSSYAFSHGDFTPWNVYYVDGAMEAFDFEYCNYSMPCYIDVFHYLTQLSVLGKKNEVGGTVHLYKKYRNLLEQYICDPDFTYACYLIYIISFYKQRTESNVDIYEKYEQWVGLLEYILEKIDKENKDVH